MSWSDFYLVCFLVGFALSAVPVLFGHTHFHLPHHHHAAQIGQGAHFPFFNFSTTAAFLAWFGGAGYLITRYSAIWVWFGLGLAVASGLAGAAAVFWFVVKVLLAREQDLNPADYRMPGVLGRVSCPIREGGTGEIIYSRAGARRTSGARSEDGVAIPNGTEVVVTRYESGIAYVRPWDELVQ